VLNLLGSTPQLAGYLGEQGQAGQESRQWRAALQTRLDHPQPHPEWGLRESDLEVVITMLAQHLANRGQIQQALALEEKALENGWLQSPAAHHLRCLELSRDVGDSTRQEKYWLALHDVLPSLENREKLWVLERLSDTIPRGQMELRPKLLAQLRSTSEAQAMG
jgi:hypothetical protein